jgi:hypothetical protein
VSTGGNAESQQRKPAPGLAARTVRSQSSRLAAPGLLCSHGEVSSHVR